MVIDISPFTTFPSHLRKNYLLEYGETEIQYLYVLCFVTRRPDKS